MRIFKLPLQRGIFNACFSSCDCLNALCSVRRPRSSTSRNLPAARRNDGLRDDPSRNCWAESSSKCTTINVLSMGVYGGEVNLFGCQEAEFFTGSCIEVFGDGVEFGL